MHKTTYIDILTKTSYLVVVVFVVNVKACCFLRIDPLPRQKYFMVLGHVHAHAHAQNTIDFP